MSTNITAPVVAADDDILAAEWNEMRDDIIVNAGDYETAGGDGNTVTLAIDSSIVAYAAGQKFRFQANASNTGVATLNVNAIGAQTIKKRSGIGLSADDIQSGQEVEVVYDGTDMIMISQTGNAENVIETLNAGAAINGGTLPVPVYQSTADNELYACDGNDTSTLNFIGFAISNSTDGNPISFQGSGIVGGFSGLAEGEKYYVQDAVGTVGTSIGTYGILVGEATSTTELLIKKATSPVGVPAATGGVALATTYQNTYGKPITIIATLQATSAFGNGDTITEVNMDSSTPPTTIIGSIMDRADTGGGAGLSGTRATVTFIVPEGHYWRYDNGGGGGTSSIVSEYIYFG